MTITSIHAVFAVVCSVAVATAQDTIRLRNGTVEQGRIEAEDLAELKLKIKKGKDEQPRSVAWTEVAEIVYGGSPELQQALGQLAGGNAAAALPRLQSLLAGSSLRKELRPVAAYNLAAGQARLGQFTEAAATLKELFETAPRSRYLLPAGRLLTEIHVVRGEFDAGASALDAAAKAARDGGVDPRTLCAFDCYRGMLLLEKKDPTLAKVAFQAALRADEASGIVDLAKLGLARVDAAAGRTEEARTACRGLIEQARGGNEVLAGAWNTLAALTLHDGDAKHDAEQMTDALFMYLRGVVEYAPAPTEATVEYERSLAGAAAAFQKLADVEPDEAVKKLHAQRARQRLDQLKKEFPYSAFSPK